MAGKLLAAGCVFELELFANPPLDESIALECCTAEGDVLANIIIGKDDPEALQRAVDTIVRQGLEQLLTKHVGVSAP